MLTSTFSKPDPLDIYLIQSYIIYIIYIGAVKIWLKDSENM